MEQRHALQKQTGWLAYEKHCHSLSVEAHGDHLRGLTALNRQPGQHPSKQVSIPMMMPLFLLSPFLMCVCVVWTGVWMHSVCMWAHVCSLWTWIWRLTVMLGVAFHLIHWGTVSQNLSTWPDPGDPVSTFLGWDYRMHHHRLPCPRSVSKRSRDPNSRPHIWAGKCFRCCCFVLF